MTDRKLQPRIPVIIAFRFSHHQIYAVLRLTFSTSSYVDLAPLAGVEPTSQPWEGYDTTVSPQRHLAHLARFERATHSLVALKPRFELGSPRFASKHSTIALLQQGCCSIQLSYRCICIGLSFKIDTAVQTLLDRLAAAFTCCCRNGRSCELCSHDPMLMVLRLRFGLRSLTKPTHCLCYLNRGICSNWTELNSHIASSVILRYDHDMDREDSRILDIRKTIAMKNFVITDVCSSAYAKLASVCSS